MAEATLFAIKEINQNGGLLGREIQPIIVDGRSDNAVFAREAENLIASDQVSAVFGCETSACRKTVRPLFEKYNSVLFFPAQYEGFENSLNIVYTGLTANQQIIPSMKWSLDHLGKRYYLVGTDYIYPRAASLIIKEILDVFKGEMVGEIFVPLNEQDFSHAVAAIQAAQPDVILNVINSDSNLQFYKTLKDIDIPVMSFSLTEREISAIRPSRAAGDYVAHSYFESVDTPENRKFLIEYKKEHPASLFTASMEAAWLGVHLWANAVREVQSAEWADFRSSLKGRSMISPGGAVAIDSATMHTWRNVRIGQIKTDGSIEIKWDSVWPVRPESYPLLLSRTEWGAFLNDLNQSWDGNWSAPIKGGRP